MNYRYQPPTEPRPDDDDDDSRYDDDAMYEGEYGDGGPYRSYDVRDAYNAASESDSGSKTPTWLKVIIVVGAFLIVASLVLSMAGPVFFGAPERQQTETQYEIAAFVSATNPSTIVVDIDGDQATVKLIGVESAGAGEWFDSEVVRVMDDQLNNTSLTLESGAVDTDSEGNLLRYAIRSDGSLLNGLLIANGFAIVGDTEPGNDRYIARMRGAEELARVDGLGVWGLSQ